MAKSYMIPDNFIEGGKLFGGTVKTRNFIEGIVLGGALAIIALMLPLTGFRTRIAVTIFMAAPGFLLGMFGVNNDPLSAFLMSVRKWRKNRKVMLFNGSVRSRSDDIVEKMLDQKTPQEIFQKNFGSFFSKDENQSKEFIEGVNFVFEEDEELTKYSEQPKSQDKASKKDKKRRKKDIDPDANQDLADQVADEKVDVANILANHLR